MPARNDWHSEPLTLLTRDQSGTEGAAVRYTTLQTTRAFGIESLGSEELTVYDADQAQEGFTLRIRFSPRVRDVWDNIEAVDFRGGRYEVQSRSGEYPALDRTLTVTRRIGAS